MNELENNNEADLMPAKKSGSSGSSGSSGTTGTKGYILSPLEASIQSRKNNLNFPALQSMFELKEDELQAILDKLPPIEDCNC
jgi:hypothetical protein